METFTIDVPSLLSLTVWNNSEDHYKRFVIHSHSLNKLDIVEEQGEVNLISDMPELVEASLRTYESKGNVLESLTFVKRLSLSLDYRVIHSSPLVFFFISVSDFCFVTICVSFVGSVSYWHHFLSACVFGVLRIW